MGSRVIALRYDGECTSCAQPLARGMKAHYDSAAKSITCVPCVDGNRTPEDEPPVSLDRGTAGASPQHEYDRRRRRRAERLEAKWGRFAPIAKALTTEPQSTDAWMRGAEGERKLAARLDKELKDRAISLHSRRIPRSRADIDHVVIAASGVWVIDAKNYRGKVECRDVGGWRKIDRRLFVAGRDKTHLVANMVRQVDAVHAALEPFGRQAVPVHAVLCFTDSEWPIFARIIELNDVRIMWAKKLCELIAQSGPLSTSDCDHVARRLSELLPPAN